MYWYVPRLSAPPPVWIGPVSAIPKVKPGQMSVPTVEAASAIKANTGNRIWKLVNINSVLKIARSKRAWTSIVTWEVFSSRDVGGSRGGEVPFIPDNLQWVLIWTHQHWSNFPVFSSTNSQLQHAMMPRTLRTQLAAWEDAVEARYSLPKITVLCSQLEQTMMTPRYQAMLRHLSPWWYTQVSKQSSVRTIDRNSKDITKIRSQVRYSHHNTSYSPCSWSLHSKTEVHVYWCCHQMGYYASVPIIATLRMERCQSIVIPQNATWCKLDTHADLDCVPLTAASPWVFAAGIPNY